MKAPWRTRVGRQAGLAGRGGGTRLIRVLLVDDDPRILQAWRGAFAQRPEFVIVGERMEADDLEAALLGCSPDQVVIDLTMNGADPLEMVARLSESFPSVRFVVHSAHSDFETIQRAFDAGAWGYVDKLSAATSLFDVLRRVAEGEVVFPPGTESMPPGRG